MAVALRSVGVSPGGWGSDTVIVKPAGLTAGDLMVAHIVRSVGGGDFVDPAGWTIIIVNRATVGAKLYYKIADAADVAAASFTFGITPDGNVRGAITAWTGYNTATPIGASNGGDADSSTITSPAITPGANSMICMCGGILGVLTISTYAVAVSNPGAWSEAYDMSSADAPALSMAMGYALRPESTATGDGTATASGSAHNVGQLVSINAPVASKGSPIASRLVSGNFI
jgi:hypothetical protein